MSEMEEKKEPKRKRNKYDYLEIAAKGVHKIKPLMGWVLLAAGTVTTLVKKIKD
ncbi:hypothetical protein M2145_001023 [Lachnospiraceae bacterium PF1-21]